MGSDGCRSRRRRRRQPSTGCCKWNVSKSAGPNLCLRDRNRDQHNWKHLQKNKVPGKREVALELRDHKDQTRDRAEGSHDHGIDPTRVLVLMSLSRIADVGAVEADDRDRKDELKEAKDGVDNEGYR